MCMNDDQKIKRFFSFFIKSEKPASPTIDHILKKNLDSYLLKKAIQEKNDLAILAIMRHAKKQNENNNWYLAILKKLSPYDVLYFKTIESNIDKE